MTTVDRLMAMAEALADEKYEWANGPQTVKARAALLSALQEVTQSDSIRAANEAWHIKTDWVQEAMNNNELPVKYLGWHRADILKSLVQDLTAERDAYQVAADKLAGELKALQELTVERDDLRLQVISAIGETQAAYEKMDALRQAYGLMHGSSK